jgi:hypothetical protein
MCKNNNLTKTIENHLNLLVKIKNKNIKDQR